MKKISIDHLKKWIKSYCYQLLIPRKVKKVRQKEEIVVLFIIQELGAWKTEPLYLAMLAHPRFRPLLGITDALENLNERKQLTEYVEKKGYKYFNLDRPADFDDLNPDVIFYQKPYPGCIPEFLDHRNHYKQLFCDINYAFNSLDIFWTTKQPLYKDAWMLFFENEMAAQSRRPLLTNRGKNIVVTGMPIQDQLLIDRNSLQDPWLNQPNKKRIIYAPHHTIGNQHLDGIDFSTFLQNGELMLEIAEKYNDQVQWIFKPHPLLFSKLEAIWGKQKTEEYYKRWETNDYSQVALGRYDAIFAHSDAMIHDCCSFRIEYQYTLNPALYLQTETYRPIDHNKFAKVAYDLHYKGVTADDIINFIEMVIAGEDPKLTERKQFYNQQLVPPHGKTACENIINALLGEAEYRQ